MYAAQTLPITRDGLPMADNTLCRTQFSCGIARLLCLAFIFGGPLSTALLSGSELRESPIVKAVQRVQASVVNIRGEKTVTTPAAASPVGSQTAVPEVSRRVNGMGTGVIIDARGYIMTNFHVVDGVREIHVTLSDGQRFMAKLTARDTETDLAVIKIDAHSDLPVIPIASSADLMTGETVIALGNAYGYENTVTRGIISALHRAVQVSDAQYYDDLIQTDASINPGNSGGPLLNIDGEMIGINVAVRAGAQGIGFAIPANKVTSVAASLLATSNINRGWLGVLSLNEPASADVGMVVGGIEPTSPAAEVGLSVGDKIVRVDDVVVRRPLDFQRAMLERKPGDKFILEAQRGNTPMTFTVKLAELRETLHPIDQPAWDAIGLELQQIPAEEFQKRYGNRYHGGLIVLAVRSNSPASNQGIQKGDVLVGMHIWETISLDNVTYILNRSDFSEISPLKFFILRDGETRFGYLPLSPTKTAQRQ
jgi:serine protease Do